MKKKIDVSQVLSEIPMQNWLFKRFCNCLALTGCGIPFQKNLPITD